MKRIAYIPARSGSKGIPKKNIRPLCGKPLMGWMIEAALKTELFDRVMVSTDTEEFAEVARSCGAWVPFLRDPSVAKDTTSSIETVCSDKARLEAMGEVFDTFCLLQPTSPLCRSEDIVGAIAFHEKVMAGIASVRRSRSRPLLLRALDDEGRAIPLINQNKSLRRQDESAYYELNGAIYINAWGEVLPTLQFACNPYGFKMSEVSSIDIDTEEDFELAEKAILKLGESNQYGC